MITKLDLYDCKILYTKGVPSVIDIKVESAIDEQVSDISTSLIQSNDVCFLFGKYYLVNNLGTSSDLVHDEHKLYLGVERQLEKGEVI